MSYRRERETFIARFMRDAATAHPEVSAEDAHRAALLLLRHATTHGRLAVMSCNGHPAQVSSLPAERINALQDRWDAWIEKREAQIEKRMRAILAPFPAFAVTFGGDPRGYTVKLKLPSGAYNTWGGSEDGFGVPQRD